jgi:hypothetical protein
MDTSATWPKDAVAQTKRKPKAHSTTAAATLFHHEWMLEAASLGRWEQVEVVQDGVVVARLPYLLSRKFGVRTIGMPYYTRVLGPVLTLPPSKPSRRIENATKLIGQLFAALPQHDRFHQSMPVSDQHTVAFALNNLTVESDFTFVITPDRPPESVLADMKGTQKRNIVTTFDRLNVREHRDLDQFIALAHDQVAAQQVQSRFRFDEIAAIFSAALKHKCVTILSAYDANDQNMGTTIVLHDQSVAYFWLTARRPVEGNRAYSRLVWEAFQFAHRHGLIFDIDGSYNSNSARYIAEFGGTPAARHVIRRQNLWFQTLDLTRKISRAVTERR